MSRSGRLFWPLAAMLVLADCSTKRLAERTLGDAPRSVMHDVVQFTLAYNPGAAFGSRFGPYQRWLLIAGTLLGLAIVSRVYSTAVSAGRLSVVGLALVTGGAIGNMLDRVLSARGVVDFIDVGVGDTRFWVFNLADVGVSVGAVLLAWALWRQDRHGSASPLDGGLR